MPGSAFADQTLHRVLPASRSGFRLRAADQVEMWSPTGCSDTGKSSPLNVRLWSALVVLDQGEWVVEMLEKGAPSLVSSGFSETDRVVIRLLSLNEQQVVGASSRSA